MGEEHRGAPDVCVTTSGNAGTNRQKGREAGRKAQDSGSSSPPLPDLTHRGLGDWSCRLYPLPYLPEGAMVLEAWTRGQRAALSPWGSFASLLHKANLLQQSIKTELGLGSARVVGVPPVLTLVPPWPSLPRNLRWSHHSWNHSPAALPFIPGLPHPQWPL